MKKILPLKSEKICFSVYLSDRLSDMGISKKHIADILDISYSTCKSKFVRDSFDYYEIVFLDRILNLNYFTNINNYLTFVSGEGGTVVV